MVLFKIYVNDIQNIVLFLLTKANVDHQIGLIDTWPAHSTNQRPANIQIGLSKQNGLVLSNSQAEGKPDLTPKPKFLESLEKFLQKELKSLGCNDVPGSSEPRLQVVYKTFYFNKLFNNLLY